MRIFALRMSFFAMRDFRLYCGAMSRGEMLENSFEVHEYSQKMFLN